MEHESSSQPLVYDPIISRTASLGKQKFYRTTQGQITEIERDEKINKFEKDLLNIQQQILENDLKLKKKNKDLRIYYFVGRLNPPHDGHIETLRQLIQIAINQNRNNPNYKIIILLGSGPKNGNPLDNPLSFKTKKDFITYKLKILFPTTDNFDFDTNVEILDMNTAPLQISNVALSLITENIETIQMLRASGMKDGDVNKLKFIESSIRKLLSKFNDILTTDVIGIDPVTNEDDIDTPISATQVRLSILNDYINSTDTFETEYRNIYERFLEKIKREIFDIADIVGVDKVREYITKKTPKAEETAGGSKRKRKTKRRKTKRRKSRKHRKTKRRHYR
jgi:hypothetical protein